MESDGRVGIKTLSTVFGIRVAVRTTAAVGLLTLAATAFLPIPVPAFLVALALGVWSIGWPAWALLRAPTSTQAARYFNRASLYPALVLAAELVALAVRSA